MELPESRGSTDGWPTGLGEKFQPRRVVVAVDATIELNLTALRYALENFVGPGQNVSLLGILHPVIYSVGYQQKAEGSRYEGKQKSIPKDLAQQAISKKHAEFQKVLSEQNYIYQLIDSKKVIFDIQIAAGPDRKEELAKMTVDLRASWVFLDQHLREDKAYLTEQLNCNVVLMKCKDEATMIKLELPQAEHPNVLEWKKRWKTAVGTARALQYLHEECEVGCIVHLDVHNIPVTYDVVPMVGVFAQAMSSQPSGDESRESRCRRMRGYLAPEYAESGKVSVSADVYSFGVLVLQLITGRKAIDATRAEEEESLTEWVRPLIQWGKTQEIVDPRLRDVCDVDQVKKMVHVAGRCISMDPTRRPNMSEVLRILERGPNIVSSTGSSTNDVSDILRYPSTTKCLLQTNLITVQTNVITFQTNLINLQGPTLDPALDSSHSKGKGVQASHNVTAAPSQSHRPAAERPRKNAHGKIFGYRRASTHRPRSRSPSRKSSSHISSTTESTNRRAYRKLSYDDMLS